MAIGETAFEPRVAAAWAALKELEGRPEVVGAYHFGSSSRPYADAQSDIDVGIVGRAERLAALVVEIKQLRTKLTAQKVDLSYWPDTLLAAPRGDNDRRRMAHCRILFDPTGALAEAQTRLAVVPEAVRQVRVRLHYFELARIAHLIVKADERKDGALVAMLIGKLVEETAKLLFIERGQWPSPVSWMRQELALLDVPVNASLWALIDAPQSAAVRLFRRRLDRYLLDRGLSFVADPMALLEWYFASDEGVRARAEWCAPDWTG